MPISQTDWPTRGLNEGVGQPGSDASETSTSDVEARKSPGFGFESQIRANLSQIALKKGLPGHIFKKSYKRMDRGGKHGCTPILSDDFRGDKESPL